MDSKEWFDSRLKVIWFDPGAKTGVAWANVPVESSFPVHERVLEAWKEGGAMGGCAELRGGIGPDVESATVWKMIEWIERFEPDVVGMEDFRLFPDREHPPDQSGTTPMRIIAAFDMMWWLVKREEMSLGLNGEEILPEYVKQMPGERSVVTPVRLRRWGLWRTPTQGGGKDAMAATQHLVVFLRKRLSGLGGQS